MNSRIELLVDQMTLQEQVSLLSGIDAWTTPSVPRLGIGKLKVTDGPNGARGDSMAGGTRAAAFPVGICLGATWNPSLVHKLAGALAREVKARGAHMCLGPTINMQRSVTNGRNFECFSEDPILTSQLAVAYVMGLQDQGIAATVKHFAGNESEFERTTIETVADERTLRELYLVPFEAAVRKARTWGVMSAYNKLNGAFSAENQWLLKTILREQWGYDGIVMSDWWGSSTTAPTILAGLDLEMPGPPRNRGEKLVEAVRSGEVPASEVRARALSMLRLLERTGALDAKELATERGDNRPETRALIRLAATEGAVLLKNNGILPLNTQGRIAVIGPNAKVAQAMGGGSSQLNPYYLVTPWDGLVEALGEHRLAYARGATNARFQPIFEATLEAEYFNGLDLQPPVVGQDSVTGGIFFNFHGHVPGVADPKVWSARFTGQFTPTADGLYEVGITSVGATRVYVDDQLVVDNWTNWVRGNTFFEEGSDEAVGTVELANGRPYEIVVELSRRSPKIFDIPAFRLGIGLPLGDDAIEEAVALARDAETAIVFVGRNGEWDTEGWDLQNIALPGRQDELVKAVASANPRTVVVLQTGGPIEMPWAADVAAVLQAWYPGQEVGNAIADVLTGRAEPSGRLPQTWPRRWKDNPTHSQDPEVYPGHKGRVRYEEGVFIGYRHYERSGIDPQFSFGFGLSYTSFSIDNLAIDSGAFEARGELDLQFDVVNIGDRVGSEVAQIYVGSQASGVPRPPRELKAFRKVRLGPGKRRRVSVRLEPRDFAFYSVETACWVIEPGEYALTVGRHAMDDGLKAIVERTTRMTVPI